MKIRNQFIITIISFAVMLLIINLSIFYTNQRAAELANQQDVAGNIQNNVGDLSHISNYYFLHQDSSTLADWNESIATIYGNLTELSMQDSQQDIVIGAIREDIQQVDNAFSNTASFLQMAPRNQSVRILPEFQLVWGKLTDKTQQLSSDSAQLSQLLRGQTDQAHQSNLFLIVVLLIVFGLYFFVNYFITFRGTLKSISKLQAGTRIIGSGDLDYSVKTNKNDEIGELSDSFNQMAINLKSLTAKLKDQERLAAIGQTAGMVGHDLRNPLQAISGEVYLAKKEVQLLPESQLKTNMQESVDAIEEQITYMEKIVSDLQAFVRPVQVQKQVFNVKQFIDERLAEIHVPSNVKTEIQVEEDLALNADPQLMKRVLINLITNSIQAMPKGGELNIRAQINDASKVKILVEDTGIGIPEEVKPKLFAPLFTTKSKGQGFGLAVCKRVIEAQGGTITFESEVGKGAKFTIELPWKK